MVLVKKLLLQLLINNNFWWYDLQKKFWQQQKFNWQRLLTPIIYPEEKICHMFNLSNITHKLYNIYLNSPLLNLVFEMYEWYVRIRIRSFYNLTALELKLAWNYKSPLLFYCVSVFSILLEIKLTKSIGYHFMFILC